MNIEKLDLALRAVCPIYGVNSERVIAFMDIATDEQRQAAQDIANAWDFDYVDIPTNVQLKNKEIKDRTSQYKLDIKETQSSWTSATISDGIEEEAKKQQIKIDLIDLKLEYNNDITLIKNKYQN